MSSNLKVNSLVPATGTEIGIGTTGGSIDFRCPATFGGNVTIGGTLTYDEVINIDSIGIITARTGLNVSSGTATFAGAIDANADLDVDGHTNLDNVSIAGVTTASGNITIENAEPSLFLTDTNGNPDYKIFNDQGAFKIYDTTYSATRLQIGPSNGEMTVLSNTNFPNGITMNPGTASVVNTIAQRLGDTDTKIRFPAADTFSVETAGVERLRITSTGQIGIGTETIRNSRAMQLTGASNSIFLMTGHAPSICLNRDPDDTSDGDRSFFGVSSVSNGFANGTAAGDTIIRGNSSGKLHFATSTSIRMSIASSGDTTLYGSNVSLAIGTLYIPDSLVHNGDNDTKIRFPSNDNISFETGGSERFRVATDSVTATNRIISPQFTTSSSFTSHNGTFYGGDVNTGGVRIELAHTTTTVSGNTASGAFPHHLLLSNYSGSGSADNRMCSIGFDIPTTGSHANATIAYQATASNGTGDLQFWLENGNTSYERLRITSGGQLLISGNTGWNESSSLLSIATDAAAGANMLSDSSAVYNHNNPAFIHVQNRYNTGTGQEAGIILHSKSSYNGSWAIYSKRSTSNYLADLIFRCRTGGSSSAQRFRMNSSGMMGFNGNPNRYLHVYGRTDGGNFGTAAFEQNNTGNSAAVMFMSTLRDGSSGESFLQCNRDQDNNGQGVRAVFYIRTNGDVDSDTNSYGGISDIKLKENIVDANSQWDDIKNIKVRNFNFKDNPSQKMLGVVAQEVETVSAGLVKDCPDENITSPGPEGTSTKSVKYSILYMKAIKALQEAQTRIETLEAKVSALEGS